MTQPSGNPLVKPTLLERVKASPMTFALSAANVAWFLWAEKHGSTANIDILIRFGAVQPTLVHAGQWWRVASYMFLHIGWAHLLLNTWAGASWCVVVERLLGSRRFLFLYLLAGVGGGVSCVLFSKAVTAGASGAMFGIIGALMAVKYRIAGSFAKFSADRGVRSTVAQIVLWIFLGVYVLPMSNAGHIGGLLTGGVATWVMTLRQRRNLAWAVFGGAFAAFSLVAIQPWGFFLQPSDVDFRNVKIGRLGQPTEHPDLVAAAAGPACARGVQRACVVDAIGNLDLQDKANVARAAKIFHAACLAGDADACAGEGELLLGGLGMPQDIDRGREMLNDACTRGSEYACEIKL